MEKDRRGSNPILDTLGITGLVKEGVYGFLGQNAFPLIYKISREVREGVKQPDKVTTPDRILEIGDAWVTLAAILVGLGSIPAAVALKWGYNFVANNVYEGLKMDQKIAARKPRIAKS